jgi:pimeloyl-ACP methyl ester carboxylesterase
LKLAMQHPERLKSACIGAAAWLRTDEPEAAEFIAKVSQSLDEGKGPLPLLERLNPATDSFTLARIKSTNSVLKIMNDSKALAAAFRSFPNLAIGEKELVSCKVPIQFLIGTKDPAPTSVERLKSVAPRNFKITEIKNADHMSTISSPLFYNSLAEFISLHR